MEHREISRAVNQRIENILCQVQRSSLRQVREDRYPCKTSRSFQLETMYFVVDRIKGIRNGI